MLMHRDERIYRQMDRFISTRLLFLLKSIYVYNICGIRLLRPVAHISTEVWRAEWDSENKIALSDQAYEMRDEALSNTWV